MKRAWIGAAATVVLAGAAVGGCRGDEPPVIITRPLDEPLENPPAISGGSLAITRDGRTLVAADADYDQLHVIDAAEATEVATHQLEAGAEPGRVIEGADGIIYVALRRAGEIARLDLASGDITRGAACPAPRGIAFDGELHVACAGGELVTMSAELEVLSSQLIERDLRDVVVAGDKLVVSKFRSAEVLVIEGGAVVHRMRPNELTSVIDDSRFTPAVAWRMQALDNGDVVVVHQRGLVGEVPIEGTDELGNSPYGGTCGDGILHAAVTVFDPESGGIVTMPDAGGIGTLVLPVDAAVAPDGRVAVVAAGNDRLFESSSADLITTDVINNCFPGAGQRDIQLLGEPLAVVYSPGGELFVQTRQPAGVHRVILDDAGFDQTGIGLKVEPRSSAMFAGSNRRHIGHALFHKAASPMAPIACASCHPEGRDDGRVWSFETIGARRTQNLAGGIMDTLPLHWDGTLSDLHELMGEVFVERMGGTALPADREDALAEWIHRIPLLPRAEPVDPDSVSRGEAIFHDAEVGCAGCHSGETLTNNATVAVGTGEPLQVPSLRGISDRAPFMHNGCAQTLADRFDPLSTCGGGDQHGKTSHLDAMDVADLIAYLETL